MKRDENGMFVVGDYVLAQRLGQGAYGVVRLGKSTVTGEKVAAKIFKKEKLGKQDLIDLQNEKANMKELDHKNIIKLVDVIDAGEYIVLMLELAGGGEIEVPEGGFPPSVAQMIFRQVIQGLAHCHQRGVAHLDIKPANILIGKGGVVKLADFGLSRKQGDDVDSQEVITHGSPRFAAPEVYRSEAKNGFMADMWACGVLLYYLLTGVYPFDLDRKRKARHAPSPKSEAIDHGDASASAKYPAPQGKSLLNFAPLLRNWAAKRKESADAEPPSPGSPHKQAKPAFQDPHSLPATPDSTKAPKSPKSGSSEEGLEESVEIVLSESQKHAQAKAQHKADLQQIRVKVCTTEVEWLDAIAPDAMALIQALMNKDVDKRLTVQEVLLHSWMTSDQARKRPKPLDMLSKSTDSVVRALGGLLKKRGKAKTQASPPTSPPTSPRSQVSPPAVRAP
eukprot:TRINITY_DN2066_c0_g1_i1.p1 TRINITY_DN2066_c0_g1~~TRINITY_DN2066_c0_g1_i1.p1  ORF type:complete len:449 (+),score=203.05 TRINITY_DN2066_c0_g1_i1:61-1407(+)